MMEGMSSPSIGSGSERKTKERCFWKKAAPPFGSKKPVAYIDGACETIQWGLSDRTVAPPLPLWSVNRRAACLKVARPKVNQKRNDFDLMPIHGVQSTTFLSG
jgi:hypothetical protein